MSIETVKDLIVEQPETKISFGNHRLAAQSYKKAYVYYHAGCNDGFSAVWAWRYSCGSEPEKYDDKHGFVPIAYNREDTTVAIEYPEPTEVWFLDYCPNVATVEALLKCDNVLKIHIVDHHETGLKKIKELFKKAKKDGVELPTSRLGITVDMLHSGAVLAWKILCGTKVPRLLKYVQDRDLWQWELQNSRAINTKLMSEPHTFDRWDTLHTIFGYDEDTYDDLGFISYVAQGEAIMEHKKQAIERIASTAWVAKMFGHEVPVVNSQYMMSEMGEYLNEQYPEAAFSAVWFMMPGGRQMKFSLRTRRDDVNVAKIAEACGGGGHRRASGFYMPTNEMLGMGAAMVDSFLKHVAELQLTDDSSDPPE